jgi:hypothetical protein
MEKENSSETFVYTCQTARYHNPEDHNISHPRLRGIQIRMFKTWFSDVTSQKAEETQEDLVSVGMTLSLCLCTKRLPA